jgi:hypothetical protein
LADTLSFPSAVIDRRYRRQLAELILRLRSG